MAHTSSLNRLKALESLLQPDQQAWSARSREILRDFDQPPVITRALRYASRKAYRRILAGVPPLPDDGRTLGWTPYFDRFGDIDHEELIRLSCREVWQLADRGRAALFVDAVGLWLAEADNAGWPELEGCEMTPEAFWADVRSEWRSLNPKRGMMIPEAAEWRRRNPAWSPDLSEDELIAFDTGVLNGG